LERHFTLGLSENIASWHSLWRVQVWTRAHQSQPGCASRGISRGCGPPKTVRPRVSSVTELALKHPNRQERHGKGQEIQINDPRCPPDCGSNGAHLGVSYREDGLKTDSMDHYLKCPAEMVMPCAVPSSPTPLGPSPFDTSANGREKEIGDEGKTASFLTGAGESQRSEV
jgi:hypothetical protein